MTVAPFQCPRCPLKTHDMTELLFHSCPGAPRAAKPARRRRAPVKRGLR